MLDNYHKYRMYSFGLSMTINIYIFLGLLRIGPNMGFIKGLSSTYVIFLDMRIDLSFCWGVCKGLDPLQYKASLITFDKTDN